MIRTKNAYIGPRPDDLPPKESTTAAGTEKITVKGRVPRIIEHDSGLALRRGPIMVHLIQDTVDDTMFLNIDGEWTRRPNMRDAHNPREAAEEHIAKFRDPVKDPVIEKMKRQFYDAMKIDHQPASDAALALKLSKIVHEATDGRCRHDVGLTLVRAIREHDAPPVPSSKSELERGISLAREAHADYAAGRTQSGGFRLQCLQELLIHLKDAQPAGSEVTCYLTEEDPPADHDLTHYGAVCGRCYNALADLERNAREGERANERDALRWRRLMSCERIRVIGSAKLGTPEAHIGVEFWGKYPGAGEQKKSDDFEKFVDGLDDQAARPPEANNSCPTL